MRTLSKAALLIAAAASAIASEPAVTAQERIAGRAEIIDGDSFEIGRVGVRLFGVDAPEGRQPCTRGGREWRCGDAAAAELRRLVGSRDVVCVQRDVDTYGRIVATCRSGTTDLGAAMVRSGLAVAYRRYSDDYVDEEREAQAAQRGLWAGAFTVPETWRRDERTEEPSERQRSAAEPRASAARRDGCAIKGNINGNDERIYHVPGSASYSDTDIDTSRGERWFCSEAEARRAGWRAPRG